MKGGRTTDIDGTELHHVTNKLTEKYDSGQGTMIASGGREETIDGGIKVEVQSGTWTQNVKGSITISSSEEINIISGKAINMKAPKAKFEPKFHNISMTAFNESFTGNSFSMTGISGSRTGASFSHSNVSVSYNAFGYSNKAMELTQIKTVITSGALSMSSKLLTLFL